MNLVLYVEQRSDMTQKVVEVLFTSNGHRLIVV